jgi:hypothetical protein
MSERVCVCACVCVYVCIRACVCACMSVGGDGAVGGTGVYQSCELFLFKCLLLRCLAQIRCVSTFLLAFVAAMF